MAVQQTGRFWRAIGNLLLAMINATLILVVVALFLGWKVLSEANQITETFASNLIEIEPLTDQLQQTQMEFAALRGDLAELRAQGNEVSSETLTRVSERVDDIETRITTATDRIDSILGEPEQLIDYAIEQSADALRNGVSALGKCVIPDNLPNLDQSG